MRQTHTHIRERYPFIVRHRQRYLPTANVGKPRNIAIAIFSEQLPRVLTAFV